MKLKISALFLVLVLVGGVFYILVSPARNVGYAPRQPIPFSHKLHAGQYKVPCLYCHSNVEKGSHATVPSVNICMNCHSVVKIDSPYIQQIRKAWEEQKPIEWVRIHELADYVHFNHKRHLARGIDCKSCHGDVGSMDVVRQTEPLNMGWCIDCHRKPENAAPISCSTCHY